MNIIRTKDTLIKKQRVIQFFLDAAVELAEESGIESITLRSVAKRAGYNSATIYNYFEGLDQLIAFTAIRCISDFYKDVSSRLHNISEHPASDYVETWRCYCMHSFAKPAIFTYVYASDPETMNNVQCNVKNYLEIFPDAFSSEFDRRVLNAFAVDTYIEHNRMWIRPFAEAGAFSPEDADDILEFASILHNGLLHKALTLKDKTPEEYTALFMKYFLPFIRERANM